MSRPHDIDNDLAVGLEATHIAPTDKLVQLPPAVPSNLALSRVRSIQRFADEIPSASDGAPAYNSSVQVDPTEPASASAHSELWETMTMRDKGKRVARPVDIALPHHASTSDVFNMSFEHEAACSLEAGPSTSTSPISIPFASPSSDGVAADICARIYDELAQEISQSKGKERALDLAPTLPPLSFSSPRFDSDDLYPTSPTTTGPSSFGSAFSGGLPSSPSASHAGTSRRSPAPAPLPALSRMPSRRRSFSNLSTHSATSVSARARVKGTLRSASPARLVRRIFSGSRADSAASLPASPLAPPELETDVGPAGCFAPWRRDASRARTAGGTLPLDLDRLLAADLVSIPLYTPPPADAAPLRLSSRRTNSDPFPLSSVFDVVLPAPAADVFAPLALTRAVLPPSVFAERLPRELQLAVLAFVVELHEEDHAHRMRTGKWTALRAARQKWVGRDQGVRELVRLSRVCKAWHALVFDGQLWATLDLHAFPRMSATAVLHVARSAGPFATHLDLAGHGNLRASTLEHVTNSLSVRLSAFGGQTRLTYISLAGCGQLTTAALHYLLERSPALAELNLKGVPVVTNETCEVLARACRGLVKLNLARCRSLSGAGARLLLADALRDGRELPLTEVKLSGIKGITDGVLADLARAAPDLEVLDLSYCRDLHNSSLGAFVAAPDGIGNDDLARTVVLTARQAGRDPAEGGTFRRRVTCLRHIALSSCALLTDGACAHLAHATPRLELLELAGIGAELSDDGLALLLGTTPRLRKLDLEGAEDVTDATLRAITPRGDAAGQPGRMLEHLVFSGCAQLSSDAMLALTRACPRLRVLEADNTRLTGGAAREFSSLARARAITNAVLVAVDCRAIGESVARELASTTRPRLGWRAYAARKLSFIDGADTESATLLAGPGAGQDECDPSRVVLKTFFGWQTVDAVQAARNRRRRGPATRREANVSGDTNASVGEGDDEAPARARWWTPGGRRTPSAGGTAALLEMGNERGDGCVVM